jgi:hypothetical protein
MNGAVLVSDVKDFNNRLLVLKISPFLQYLSEQLSHDLNSKTLLKLFYHVRLGVVAIRALEFWRMVRHSDGKVN